MQHFVHYMLIPGCVENCTVIIDFSGLGMLNVPKDALKKIIASFQNNYRARLGKMYILNVSFLVKAIWMIVKAFIDPVTKLKIQLTNSATHPELLQLVHPDQLPKEFGGNAELSAEAWPPTFSGGRIRDEFDEEHVTEEELKKRIVENDKVVPPPELAQFAREHCKNRKQKGKKTYYFKDRIEIRDSFNGIIEDKGLKEKPAKKDEIAESPKHTDQQQKMGEKAKIKSIEIVKIKEIPVIEAVSYTHLTLPTICSV
eukprot:TRINITY_DN427_c0_g1_i1.p1 TRINITY_DN427_c0_g1~~TRINITY_DN427_c0_g1_i1.p1  ORF type:complete len:256 (-),score=70.01 TRINITY_DN427_c0_g1_i1:46-813(-)